jgi:RimJ/RimL family protein N-acetyltransferase
LPIVANAPRDDVRIDAVARARDIQPSPRMIATRRLEIHPQLAEHADEMFVLLQDPALYHYENEAPRSVERLRERFARLETRMSADGTEAWLNWVVRLPGAGLIGFVQATVHHDRSAGVAYVFGSAHWGQGYAYEAVHAMLGELAERWKVRVFRAVLKRDNARSQRLLMRLAFAPAPRDAQAPEDVADDEALMVRDIRTAALESR